MVQALRCAARNEGCAPPYHLLSMSLGAMVAIAWATDHPQEVAGAVLINTSVGAMHPLFQRLKPGAFLRLLGIAMPWLSQEDRERAILALTSNAPAPAGSELAERVRYRVEKPVALANVLRQLIAAARFAAPRQPPAAPLFVLAAAGDRLVDPACSRRLARAWPVAYAEHPSAGHDLALDDPLWLLQRVCEWMAGHGDGVGPRPAS
jgi:pimeloyl-ACP methyl ester carboxylesterase